MAAARPFASPGWLLPWWRSAAPPGARLHTVAVREAGKLVGLAPFFVAEGSLLTLGAGSTTRVEPVTLPGRENDVAKVTAPALAEAGASLLQFAGIPASSPWPELLREAWPGGAAWLHEDERMPSPTLSVEGLTFDDWFASRSSNFRNQIRKYERLLEERDAQLELAADAEALAGFARLHHARWATRGGSGVLDGGVEQAVEAAARELPPERFRLFTISAAEGPVGAALFVAAGGEVSSWLGGFDEGWRDVSPQLLLGVAAIRHAIASGDRRVDFGAGSAEYKRRLSDGEETLRWITLVPPRRGQLKTRLRLLPATRGSTRAASERPAEVPDQTRLAEGAVKSRVLANTGYRLLADVGGKVASVVLFIVMGRKLGDEGFGVFTFAFALAALVTSLADFGQDKVLTREVARDRGALDRYFLNTLTLKLVVAVPALGAAVAALALTDHSRTTVVVVALLGAAVLIDLLTSTAYAVFQAFERMEFIPIALITERFVTAVGGIVALLLGASVVPVAAVFLGGAVLAFLLAMGLLLRHVARPKPRLEPRNWWPLMRAAAPIGLAGVAGVVLFRVDTVMLAAFKPQDAVGNYGAAYRLFESTLFLSWAVGAAAFPVYSRRSGEALAGVYERTLKLVVALVLPFAVGAAVLGNQVIGSSTATSSTPPARRSNCSRRQSCSTPSPISRATRSSRSSGPSC